MMSQGQGLAAQGQGLSAPGQGLASRGQGLASHGQGLAAQGQGLAAQGQGLAPAAGFICTLSFPATLPLTPTPSTPTLSPSPPNTLPFALTYFGTPFFATSIRIRAPLTIQRCLFTTSFLSPTFDYSYPYPSLLPYATLTYSLLYPLSSLKVPSNLSLPIYPLYPPPSPPSVFTPRVRPLYGLATVSTRITLTSAKPLASGALSACCFVAPTGETHRSTYTTHYTL